VAPSQKLPSTLTVIGHESEARLVNAHGGRGHAIRSGLMQGPGPTVRGRPDRQGQASRARPPARAGKVLTVGTSDPWPSRVHGLTIAMSSRNSVLSQYPSPVHRKRRLHEIRGGVQNLARPSRGDDGLNPAT
jgi:hypothetical protein